MLFVKMDGSPAVGPRVGLVPATDVFLFDGNPPGGACGRVSRRSCMEAENRSILVTKTQLEGTSPQVDNVVVFDV